MKGRRSRCLTAPSDLRPLVIYSSKIVRTSGAVEILIARCQYGHSPLAGAAFPLGCHYRSTPPVGVVAVEEITKSFQRPQPGPGALLTVSGTVAVGRRGWTTWRPERSAGCRARVRVRWRRRRRRARGQGYVGMGNSVIGSRYGPSHSTSSASSGRSTISCNSSRPWP
jgi:hypothetical protein